MNNAQYYIADEKAGLTETANITHPVEYIVNLPIDNFQIKVHFKGDRNMHSIIEFVRSLRRLIEVEDSVLFIDAKCPIHPIILQV